MITSLESLLTEGVEYTDRQIALMELGRRYVNKELKITLKDWFFYKTRNWRGDV